MASVNDHAHPYTKEIGVRFSESSQPTFQLNPVDGIIVSESRGFLPSPELSHSGY